MIDSYKILRKILNKYTSNTDLCGDARLDPVLAQVAVGWDVAVVWGTGQQENHRQGLISRWNAGDTEQEEDSPLERAPGPQERHRHLVVLHFTGLYSTVFRSILAYFSFHLLHYNRTKTFIMGY